MLERHTNYAIIDKTIDNWWNHFHLNYQQKLLYVISTSRNLVGFVKGKNPSVFGSSNFM